MPSTTAANPSLKRAVPALIGRLGLMRPTLLPAPSVNQRSPSGPLAMPNGARPTLGSAKYVTLPEGGIRPISTLDSLCSGRGAGGVGY
jgi:hypothetical protein